MAEVALYLHHSLVYGTQRPLSVREVVESLLAMQRLSRTMLPDALSRLTDSKVRRVELFVDAIEEGSFKESFWLQLVFADEAAMQRFQAAFRALDLAAMYKELPMGNKPVIKTIVATSVVAALVSYGVNLYVNQQGSEVQRALVEANNNTIIAIGAEAYSVDPTAFAEIIQAVASTKAKALAQDAAAILAPARGEPGVTVSLGEGITFPNDVVQSMPAVVDFQPYESTEKFKNVVVDIRQMNRDSAEKGWRARILGMFDTRVKLTLGANIQIEDLEGKVEVPADVTVLYRMSDSAKKLLPVEITIDTVRQPSAQP